MSSQITRAFRIFLIMLWTITLVLLVVGLVFLFASFERHELITRILLSLAAMMSVISLAASIYLMYRYAGKGKQVHDEKENTKYKLLQLNSQNEQLYNDTKTLAQANNIQMLEIEFIPFDTITMAQELNEELMIENARIRSEIELKK